MTDLIVDLDHLTALRGLLAGAGEGPAAALAATGAVDPGALGVAELDDAWAAFRRRRRAALGRLAGAVERTGTGLAGCAAAYAETEGRVVRSLR